MTVTTHRVVGLLEWPPGAELSPEILGRLKQELLTNDDTTFRVLSVRVPLGESALTAAADLSQLRIDLEQLSRQLCGCEVELATEAEISEHCPDCEFGVLPPFGSQYAMTTVVDESLANDPKIVFEGNMHEEAIRMRFRDYMRVEEPLILAFAEEENPQGVA